MKRIAVLVIRRRTQPPHVDVVLVEYEVNGNV
jgi:hypothetical protein